MVHHGNDDGPRTFREVGYILVSIKSDIEGIKNDQNEIKTSQTKVIFVVLSGFILPLMVGLIVGYLFRF